MSGTGSDLAVATYHRLARLRDLASADRTAAQEDAWAWIIELGHRVHRHRGSALAELGTLFRTGRPSTTLDGHTEGVMVTGAVQPTLDRVVATVAQAWMPWSGKYFDAIERRGVNTLYPSARWPVKLLWPLHQLTPSAFGPGAFPFHTRVEPSVLDHEHEVLAVDYRSVPGNPRMIRSLRDEIVQVVPGVHLGCVFLRLAGEHLPLGYFALRPPVH